MSGTLAPGYFVSPFYFYFAEHCAPESLVEVTRRDTEIGKGMREGAISYNQGSEMVIRLLADLVKGRTLAEVTQAGIECFKDRMPYPFVVPLFDYLHSENFEIVIVTADFEFLIRTFLDKLPPPIKVYGSELEIENGVFTGNILKIQNNLVKLETIRKIEAENQGGFTVAFGDSEGDYPMLEAADLGFMLKQFTNAFAAPEVKRGIIYLPDTQVIETATVIKNEIAKALA